MWYQLEVSCLRDWVDSLSELFESQGCLSVSLIDKNDDPILEPEIGTTPLWPEVVIQALFAHQAEADKAKLYLAALYPNLTSIISELPDQDWQQVCMQQFKPQRFGKRLWICPSWLTPPVADALNLILDPGLAFGTGQHPTTSLCLNWLEQADLNKRTIIDYGCGSGILALAALKLGAAVAYAVDIDPQALQATTSNGNNNAITASQLKVCLPEHLTIKSDLIIANILLTPLIHLKNDFYQLLTDQGLLVVSGILRDQVTPLIENYAACFNHQDTYYCEDWALVIFKIKL